MVVAVVVVVGGDYAAADLAGFATDWWRRRRHCPRHRRSLLLFPLPEWYHLGALAGRRPRWGSFRRRLLKTAGKRK